VVIESVAVVGSGLMGRGTSYPAALGGSRTALHDVSGPAREQVLAQIRRDLDEEIARGKVSREQAAAACARIAPEPELGRGVGQHGGE